MVKNPTPERLKEVYENYKQNFSSNFHTTLWHLFIDNIFAGKVICFVQNFVQGGIRLGIATANEAGYTPTPAYFANGTTYDEAQEVLDKLNKDVFDLDELATMRITASSMGIKKGSRKFTVNCEWKMFGHLEIEADTEEEAIQKAHDMDLPDNGEYVTNSFEAKISTD